MKHVRLGKSGLKVSRLCLGAMTFGEHPDAFMAGVASDENESRKVMDAAFGAGINFIDTADIYGLGMSEEIVGRWLKDKRHSVVIATKCGFPMGKQPNDGGLSRRHILAACDASLRRLGTDVIDLYQVHFEDRRVPLEETLGALDSLVRAGKVRYLGASNHTAYRLTKSLMLQRANGWAPYVCLQPQYSLVVRDIDREILPLCRAEGLGVIPWSPLASGFLSGKYRRGQKPPEGSRLQSWNDIFDTHGSEKNWNTLDEVERIAKAHNTGMAEVALAWMLRVDGITGPIIGARNLEQLKKNLECLAVKLTDDDVRALEKASALKPEYPESFLGTV